VRLHLKNQIVLFVEFYDARVIDKHGQAEILPAFGFADFGRRAFDVGFEKGVDGFLRPAVKVINPAVEDFVFAVLRPGLREAFQLHVGRVFVQAEFPAGFDDRGIGKVCGDRLHLFEVEREELFLADFQKRRGVQPGQIDFSHLRLVPARDLRNVRGHAVYKIKFRPAHDLMALDQIVGQQAGGNVFRVGFGDRAGDQILPRCINVDFSLAEARAQ